MNAKVNKGRLRLYLIRHGEVEGATEGILLGRTDRPLSEQGISQAHQLAEELSAAQLSAVYSSDLKRARTTAEIIARTNNLQVEENSAWREINMGEWEGRTFAALHNEYPTLVAQVFNDPASFQYPSGESFSDFVARVRAALDHLLEIHHGDEVALIAHGGVCRAIIGSALGIPMKNWLCLAQDFGCLNVIEWYDSNPVVLTLNWSKSPVRTWQSMTGA